jgi:hypothetical protein
MRPSLVVVLDELDQQPLEVSPLKDQQVVEKLPACGPEPAFSERVRPR